MKKILITAAVINLITALIHTIMGGQELMVPFVAYDIPLSIKSILHACWHMVTATLFISTIALFYLGIKHTNLSIGLITRFIGILYIAYGFVFIIISLAYGIFLPQSILLIPIGILSFWGGKNPGTLN